MSYITAAGAARRSSVIDAPAARWHSTSMDVTALQRSPSLRDAARSAIRAWLITGELPAGEIFSAPSLAQKLGVSATPVREALLDLANEGLLEPVPNRGFRVVTFNERDLDEIFEFRALLEVPLVGRVAGRLDQAQVAHLRRLLKELEDAAEAGDLVTYLTADQNFHTALLEPIDNGRLIEAVGKLRDQQRLHGLPRIVHSDRFLATAQEHRAILEAVVEGNGELAEALMFQHLHHTRGVWAGLSEPDDQFPAPALT
jgi:DNA-binding GntR family transcriptional regulator